MRKSRLGIALFLGISILIMRRPAFAGNELSVEGGLVMRAWPKGEETAECVIRINAPSEAPKRRMPVQVLLLIDVSREMSGESLKNARLAAKATVGGLEDGDVLGIVAFGGYARAVAPMQPLAAGVRNTMQDQIDAISKESERNLEVGIEMAVEQFARFTGQNAAGRHIIIITNGETQKGKTEAGPLKAYALDAARKLKASISAFGLEEHFREDLLASIAMETGGRYYFSEEPENMLAQFGVELRRISKPALKNVRLELTLPDGVAITNLRGAIMRQSSIFFGDIGPGEQRIALLTLTGRPAKQRECRVSTHYTEPDDMSERVERSYIEAPLTTGKSEYDPENAPYYLAWRLYDQVRNQEGKIRNDRRALASNFRYKIQDLEQENKTLNSEYLRDHMESFVEFGRMIANTAIKDPILIKETKYRIIELLRGGD